MVRVIGVKGPSEVQGLGGRVTTNVVVVASPVYVVQCQVFPILYVVCHLGWVLVKASGHQAPCHIINSHTLDSLERQLQTHQQLRSYMCTTEKGGKAGLSVKVSGQAGCWVLVPQQARSSSVHQV